MVPPTSLHMPRLTTEKLYYERHQQWFIRWRSHLKHIMHRISSGIYAYSTGKQEIRWNNIATINSNQRHTRAFHFYTWQQKINQKPNRKTCRSSRISSRPDIVLLGVCWYKPFQQHWHFFIASRALKAHEWSSSFSWAAENLIDRGLHSFRPLLR